MIAIDNQSKVWLFKGASLELMSHFQLSRYADRTGDYYSVKMELPPIAKMIRMSELDGVMMITVASKIVTIRQGSVINHELPIPPVVNGIEVYHRRGRHAVILLDDQGTVHSVSYSIDGVISLRPKKLTVLKRNIRFIGSWSSRPVMIDTNNVVHWRDESTQLPSPVKLFHHNAIVMEDDSVVVLTLNIIPNSGRSTMIRPFKNKLKNVVSVVHKSETILAKMEIIELLNGDGDMLTIEYSDTSLSPEFYYRGRYNHSVSKRLIVLNDEICIEDVNGMVYDPAYKVINLPFILG